MNKIYKVIKNHSTGNITAVSELARGVNRSGKLKVIAISLFTILSYQANAKIIVPEGVTPGNGTNHIHGVVVIDHTDVVDLGMGRGFLAVTPGVEVTKHTINGDETINALYQTKYVDVANATNHYSTIQNNFNQGISSQTDLDDAKAALDLAISKADAISDSKFKVVDTNNLIGSSSEGVTISEKTLTYRDAVTDKAFQITVKDDLVKTQAGTSTVGGGGVSIDFYEKTAEGDQYDDSQLFKITGSTSDVQIINSGGNGAIVNNQLSAISKNGSALLNVEDGANLKLDTDITYYLGSDLSKSTAFEEKDEYIESSSTTLYKVTYKGTVNTILGSRVIDSEQAFNDFNAELIQYIQSNEQLRLDYSTAAAMQKFYDDQIAGLYTTTSLGSYEVQYTMTKDELAQLAKDQGLENEFNNRVTEDDRGTDIGLDSADSNYLVGVKGSGSVITLSEDNKVVNAIEVDGIKKISAGTVIKADFEDSGKDGNNIFKINGIIDANSGNAIVAKNAEVDVAAHGKINGNITITGLGNSGGNIVTNLGIISGNVSIENGQVDNSGTGIIGSITGKDNVKVNNVDTAKINNSVELGNNSEVNNDSSIGVSVTVGKNSKIMNNSGATIGGWVIALGGSTVINKDDATIKGIVAVDGTGSSFVNDGVAGGAKAANGAIISNNNLIAGEGSIGLYSQSTFTNDGDIYIGFAYDQTAKQVNTDVGNKDAYAAITVSDSGTQLVNNKNIYVSGNQHDVSIVSIVNNGIFTHGSSSIIELNHDDTIASTLSKETGNNNVAVTVSGSGSTANIDGLVYLNDTGSTGLVVKNSGLVTLTGKVNLNSQDIDGTSIRSFGAWVQDEGSKLVIADNAEINMNADRAIGVHVRDGAIAEIKDSASITFSDSANQIGFLISGISKKASLIYSSDKELKLQGEGSVLFRVERGSIFDSNTISSTSNSLSTLDSNGTKNSTLMVITTGGVATGSSNKTKADLSGFTLKVSGEGAKGVSVEGGATASITDDTVIALTGDDAILAKIDGWYYDLNGNHNTTYDGKSQLTSSANLTTDTTSASGVVSGERSVGYYITHGAELIHTGSIFFDAPTKNNIGVKIDSAGTLTSKSGSSIKVYGTAVEITGKSSSVKIDNEANGTAPVVWAVGTTTNDSAYHLKDKAGITLTGAGVTKAEGTAHGILVDGASNVVLNGATLDLYGDDIQSSIGNGIENRSDLTTILLKNNAIINVKDGYGIHSSVGFSTNDAAIAGIINVYGAGTGLRFEGINSTTGAISGTTTNTIINNGYNNLVINVINEEGHGIYTNSYGEVNTSTSVNIISNTGQSAIEIKGRTETASQSGNLHSANNNTVIVDLNNGYLNNYTNSGELLFGEFIKDTNGAYTFTASDKAIAATSNAIATNDTENGLTFTNATNGKINGVVELLGYGDNANPTDTTKGNTVTLNNNSEGNIFRTGEGNDSFIVNKVVGDDLGGNKQVTQFTQLDGGEGDDSVTFANQSDFTINNDNTIKNIEYFALNTSSKVTLNNLTTVDGLNTGVTNYDIIDTNSVLTYKWANSNISFDRLLNGKGTLLVDFIGLDTNNHPINEFAFDNSTNMGNFKGILELTNTKYTLADSANHNNTSALTDATLKVSENSYVKVGDGDQGFKGLYFNAGTIDFGNIELVNALDSITSTPSGTPSVAENHITVDNLVLVDGNVQVDVDGFDYNPGIPTDLTLLEQDSAVMAIQLVAANNVVGGASDLKLIDEHGNEITHETVSELMQNGENIARATYDVRLTKGDNLDGLYIGYGLEQVELKTKNDVNGEGNALILDATSSDPTKAGSNDFDVLISDYDNSDGTFNYGDLQIKGNKQLSLSGDNTYHGSTHVKETSTLVSGNHNALGYSRLLRLDTNTKFDLNGWNQTIGSLYTNSNSTVDLNGGELTISGKDGTDSTDVLVTNIAANTLTGSGQLTVGDSTLTREVSSIVKATVFGDNTTLNAAIINAINGQIDLASQGGLGNGVLTNNGELNLYFTSDSALTNTSLVGSGVINKYNTDSVTFTLAQAKDYTGNMNIDNGSLVFKGDSTTDSYQVNTINVNSAGTLVAIDNAVFDSTVNNSGKFYIGEMPDSTTVSQQTVTVKNYNGSSDSSIIFNGTLAGDDSPIGKLIITGDSSGTSNVTVNNIGGLGAKTIDGISLIDIAGQSNGEFVQIGRIIAGAYDYTLTRSSSNSNNWVLVSKSDSVRPEFGGYLGNMFAANNLFNLRLHDRLGETQYTDLLTGEQKVTSMWMRYQYGYNKFKAGNGDLSIKNNWNITQIGGDIAGWSSNGLNRLHVGIMGGHGYSKTRSESNGDNIRSDGKVDGYSFGLYATWYDNNQDKTGLYIDSWALWNNFNASVSSDEFSEKYRLKGLTAAVESGYSFSTGTLGNYDVWLQPKAQLTWGGVKSKSFTENNGTRVSFNDGNLQTRLGLRASLLTNKENQAINNQFGQLFIEANWLHNSKLYDVSVNNEQTVGLDGARNVGELKVGVEGNIVTNTNIWFNLAGQRGDHDYKNASIMLGLKYSF